MRRRVLGGSLQGGGHSKKYRRLVLSTGEVVANNWDDLTDAALAHPINRWNARSPPRCCR